MGKLIRNGIIYAGSTSSAKDVSYSNTSSQMTATNVQDAIDETNVQCATGDSFALVPTSAGNTLATTIYGMSTQDGTPTPSTPVDIDSASADFRCVGKNNLPYPWFETTHTEATIPFTDNGDGSFTIGTGTASAACRMYLCGGNGTANLEPNIFGGMKVGAIYSGGTFDSDKIYMYAQPYSADYSEHDNLNDTSGDGIIIPSYNRELIRIALYVTSGTVISSPITVRPYAIYPSVSVNPFEPYKHTDITTSLTLRSIEVTSSDPYNLVKDGHYYVADTIDWDEVDGYTLTQRIAHREYDGTEDGWAKGSATYADIYFIADSDAYPAGGTTYYGKCTLSNMFIADANGGQTEIGRCSVHDGRVYFSYATYNTSTLSDWKTFLGSNPLVMDFIKVTPTKTSLTSAQAKALLSMRTYDESTSIDAVSDTAPVINLQYGESDVVAAAITGHNAAIGGIDQLYNYNGVVGAKNLIPYPYYWENGHTYNGITFTYDSDGAVKANGTASGNVSGFRINGDTYADGLALKAGSYILSGCPSDGSLSTYRINIRKIDSNNTATTFASDIGSGVSFTVSQEDANSYRYLLYCDVLSGQTVTDLTYKPMLRLASDTDSTYQPYAETNYQLTYSKLSYKDNGVLGAKNFIPYPYVHTSKDTNGVTFTDNGDGTITVSTVNTGATDDAYFNCRARTEYGTSHAYYLKAGSYILSGCPSGGSTSTYYMWVGRGTDSTNIGLFGTDTGTGVAFDNTDVVDYALTVQIMIKSGTIITTPITFKPMLRIGSDPDNTWQPYAKTNKELTIDKAEQDETDDISNVYGAKNLIPYPYFHTGRTVNGITYTDNGDGTVTANGTATANAYLHLAMNYTLKRGQYRGSLGVSGEGTYTYVLRFYNDTEGWETKFIDNNVVDVPEDRTGTLSIRVYSGQTVNNLTFKPMLRCASIKDNTWQPYAMTNKELTDALDGLHLLKISQSDYDNLQTKDSNTLYVITS